MRDTIGWRGGLVVLALAALLAACVPAVETQPPPTPVELLGTEWVLTSLNGRDAEEGPPVTLAFPNEGELSGHAGCNYYGARYTTREDEFAIAEQRIDRTAYDCDVAASIVEQEEAYFAALASAAAYRARENRLEIDAAGGDTILTFAPKEKASIDPALEDTEWVLVQLDGAGLAEGTNITLAFDGGQAGGFAGCNHYGGEYAAAAEGVLAIPEMAITAQGCLSPEGVLEQEDLYVEALTSAAGYRLEGDRLEIANAQGDVTLVFVQKVELPMEPGDLVGTRWQLLSMAGTAPAEGAPITLVFHSERRMSGQAGCRGYVASYDAAGDDIGLHFLGMTGPAESCPEMLLSQEGEYTTHLEQATDYRLGGGQLELLTAAGAVLVFAPLPEEANASLEGTRWILSAFVEERTAEGMGGAIPLPADPLAGIEITATFEGGTVQGSAGCNGYSGGYARDGAAIAFGTLAATEMACLDPAGVMEQEQRYLALLAAVTGYRIDGSQLWLEAGDGRALVFRAQE